MFSRLDIENITNIITVTKIIGIEVIIDICWKIRNKYTVKKIIDLIRTFFLNTEIIERECFKRLI